MAFYFVDESMNIEPAKTACNLICLCVVLNVVEYWFDTSWCFMNFESLVIILTLISLCIMVNVIEYLFEWKKWNCGICAKSGKAWKFCEYCNRHRVYKDNCGNSIEILYDVDRQEKTKR